MKFVAGINDHCGKPVCANSVGIPNSTSNLSQGFAHATDTALIILGVLSVIFVLVGAFQFVISGGNPSRIKQARETIIYAMVGLVLAGSAYIIVSYVAKSI